MYVGGGSGSDVEEEPGVRDEVRDAGLQQACICDGSAAGTQGEDPDSAGRKVSTQLSHQSRRSTRHLRRGLYHLIISSLIIII